MCVCIIKVAIFFSFFEEFFRFLPLFTSHEAKDRKLRVQNRTQKCWGNMQLSFGLTTAAATTPTTITTTLDNAVEVASWLLGWAT